MSNTVHHWYQNPDDLQPYCLVIPGPDGDGLWHTGHERDVLLAWSLGGAMCCATCMNVMARGERGSASTAGADGPNGTAGSEPQD